MSPFFNETKDANMRRAGVAVGFVILLVVPGCGTPRARVHGTVKCQGEPLGGAVVTFFSADNATFTARTRSDGTYQVAGVPQGTVRVSVQVPRPRPKPEPEPEAIQKANKEAGLKSWQERPQPDQSAARRINLPARYGNPETSELSFELKEADQDYSIDLKSSSRRTSGR
jgi:hypothetical protein